MALCSDTSTDDVINSISLAFSGDNSIFVAFSDTNGINNTICGFNNTDGVNSLFAIVHGLLIPLIFGAKIFHQSIISGSVHLLYWIFELVNILFSGFNSQN